MDNRSEMLQLCRLCLVKDDVNIPIFEEQGDIRKIFLKISSCLPVKVSREDKLPKKICDGCSYKLDMLYEFWNTTANAEKQLLSWLGEAGMNSKMTDDTISAVAQQIKPTETFVKQEAIDPSDIHTEVNDDDKSYMFQQKFTVEEAGPSATVTSNEEEPPPKRARRTAAVKAQIAMDPESDDDDDSGEPMTKMEDESEDSDGEDREPTFVDVPSTSADDQPGPSGVGKDGVEAPMALHHVVLFFTIIFLWHLLACAHISLDNQKQYVSPEKSSQYFIYSPARPRKISQRAFQDLDLFTARGYGKRSDCAGRLCGKRMPMFSGARLYGKRNIDKNQLKCFFMDCLEFETKLRNMEYNRKFRRDEEMVLPE